jgi:hypothetical protein
VRERQRSRKWLKPELLQYFRSFLFSRLQTVVLIGQIMDRLMSDCLEQGIQPDLTQLNDIFNSIDLSPEVLRQSHWLSVFYTLYRIGISAELETRTKAITCLFGILREHFAKIHSDTWSIIFRTIMTSLLDTTARSFEGQAKEFSGTFISEWFSTTYMLVLRSLTDLFSVAFVYLIGYIDILLDFYRNAILHGRLISVHYSCYILIDRCIYISTHFFYPY